VKPVTRPRRTLFGTFFDVRNLMKVSEGAGRDGATRHAPFLATSAPDRLRQHGPSSRKGRRHRELQEGSSESGTNRRLRPLGPDYETPTHHFGGAYGVHHTGTYSSERAPRGARDRLFERGLLRTNASALARSPVHGFGREEYRVQNGAVT